MGRTLCCDNKNALRKGPWSTEEDEKLIKYVNKNGPGKWRDVAKNAGLQRCGKSCRLRWTNYLRPDIKRGSFSVEEEETIIKLHKVLGNKWSAIATHLPGRTDNEIKNQWNTRIKRKIIRRGIDPDIHEPLIDFSRVLNSLETLLSNPEALNHIFTLLASRNPTQTTTLDDLVNHFQTNQTLSIQNTHQIIQDGMSQNNVPLFVPSYLDSNDVFMHGNLGQPLMNSAREVGAGFDLTENVVFQSSNNNMSSRGGGNNNSQFVNFDSAFNIDDYISNIGTDEFHLQHS